MTSVLALFLGILLLGIGLWSWIEDQKTSKAAIDRFEAIDRRFEAQNTMIRNDVKKSLADITEALQQDLKKLQADLQPKPAPQEILQVQIRGPVKFIPAKRKSSSAPRPPPPPATKPPPKTKASER